MRQLLRNIKNRFLAPVFLFFSYKLGYVYALKSPDRRFLEDGIITKLLADHRYQRILFAGVEIYTWHYRHLLHDREFHTIEKDPNKSHYGNKGKHTLGSVCELEMHYGPGQFDVVLFNGLIGYGLDSAPDVEQALSSAYEVLADGGLLIIGWNNTPDHLRFVLGDLPSYRRYVGFTPYALGLTSHRHEIANSNRHTFDFLSKPASERPARANGEDRSRSI